MDFLAEASATLGTQVQAGFETYHVMNPYDDGIGLDEYIDANRRRICDPAHSRLRPVAAAV